MPREVTLKDVLYALQYGQETLSRLPRGSSPAEWVLSPSGARVKQSIADTVRAHYGVVSVRATRDGEQSFAWGQPK